MSQDCHVTVRFHPPPAPLRRYFTTFYLAEWHVPSAQRVTDYLLPEWGNFRFHSGSLPAAETMSGMRLEGSSFPVTGPNSEAIRFNVGSSRIWGIGMLPLGWAKFVRLPAEHFTNCVIDGNSHPAFARFAELGRSLFGPVPDEAAEREKLNRCFISLADEPVPDEECIVAIHAALIDPDIATVKALVERVGASQRSVERICHQHFGFAPKLMLRRQRFMRSLTHFMQDPSLRWIGAMDNHYHDQSQFIRDFQQFMGMTPRQYAALDKPLIGAVMEARRQFFGSSAQTLDGPEGMTFPA